MNVKEVSEALGATAITLPEPDREVSGAYIGDLLSWVMSNAAADNAWITIMNNVNVMAVATLTDVACVILAEGVTLDEELQAVALQKGVNVLSSPLPAYETAVTLHGII